MYWPSDNDHSDENDDYGNGNGDSGDYNSNSSPHTKPASKKRFPTRCEMMGKLGMTVGPFDSSRRGR